MIAMVNDSDEIDRIDKQAVALSVDPHRVFRVTLRVGEVESERTKREICFVVQSHSNMANFERWQPKHRILFLGSMALFVIALVILLVGFIFFSGDTPKAPYYRESNCLVSTARYQSKTCRSGEEGSTCYVPTWQVQHSGPEFIDATIELDDELSTIDGTLADTTTYQVRIFHEGLDLHCIREGEIRCVFVF